MYYYPTGVSLGANLAGLSGVIGYRLISQTDGSVVTQFTTSGVVESLVAGTYWVVGGVPIPSGFWGYLEWGTSATKYAVEMVSVSKVFPDGDYHYYATGVALGQSRSGMSGLGYRLIQQSDGDEVVEFTTQGVTETSVSGTYFVMGGVRVPDDFVGNIEWGTDSDKYAVEPISMPQLIVTNSQFPPDPSLCAVYVYAKDPTDSGSPLGDATISAVVVGENSAIDGALLTMNPKTVVTDSNGMAVLNLVRSVAFTRGRGQYQITGTDENGVEFLDATIRVPDADSVNLDDLL